MANEVKTERQTVIERLLPQVQREMQVYEVVAGGRKDGYAARFRGQLIQDSQEAFARLETVFKKEGMTLVFRAEGEDHLVLAIPGVIEPRPSNPRINLGVFVLTVISVIFAGALYAYDGPIEADLASYFQAILRNLPSGIPFAVSLLAILVAHESGHYLAARYHGTAASLPFFIPFPGSTFGTMGAFIQLKEPPRNRRALLDIGLAGPIAGLIVAIPVLLIGLSLSEVGTLPSGPDAGPGVVLEGNSVLYLAMKYIAKGELLPAPVDYGNLSPVWYWIRYVFTGSPVPLGGRDVLLHPIAWAGWAGLLVTSLNLIPVGQLDGGHASYVLLGRRARVVWPVIILGLVVLGWVWNGWWLWAALLFLLGRRSAQPLDEITPLDGKRKALAIAGILLFLIVFIPVPLRTFGGF
jgi:membrane-associated protease RseP (regulator of RpoE activity)